MNIQNLSFPPSNARVAVERIMAQLRELKDQNDVPVFAPDRVRYGWWKPEQSWVPGTDEVPACNVHVDSRAFGSNSTQLLFTENEVMISLYVMWYDHDGGEDGIGPRAHDFGEWILKCLQYPESEVDGADGIVPDPNIWVWPIELVASIDFTNAWRNLGDVQPLRPPWYAMRIDLRVEPQGVSDTFN